MIRFFQMWWRVIAGAAAALVALVLGLLAAGAYRRRVATVGDGVRVERARREIERLRGQRDVLLAKDTADEDMVLEIEEALEDNILEIVEARQRANVPDDELVNELRLLGY
jgi:hypothetical protein